VLPWKLRERWQRRGHYERLSGDEVTLVLVMSHHAHTFGSPRLSRNSRELPRHLCGTLEHREDPSFGVDEQELHDYVSSARHRRRCNAAVPISWTSDAGTGTCGLAAASSGSAPAALLEARPEPIDPAVSAHQARQDAVGVLDDELGSLR
jgi:hypothetical protein